MYGVHKRCSSQPLLLCTCTYIALHNLYCCARADTLLFTTFTVVHAQIHCSSQPLLLCTCTYIDLRNLYYGARATLLFTTFTWCTRRYIALHNLYCCARADTLLFTTFTMVHVHKRCSSQPLLLCTCTYIATFLHVQPLLWCMCTNVALHNLYCCARVHTLLFATFTMVHVQRYCCS